MAVNESKIRALINLLADDDEEVYSIAFEEILSLGSSILPILEDSFMLVESNEQKKRLDEIIGEIRNQKVETELQAWLNTDEKDLLDGWCIISQLSERYIDRQNLIKEIEQMKVAIWLGLQPNQSELEKVKFMNHQLFEKLGFEGDTKDYNHPNNSFIDSVINNRKGNPISLSTLYIILSNKLRLPIYGVNLPQHFVLAFLPLQIDNLSEDEINKIVQGDEVEMPVNLEDDPLFYINPFGKGGVFGKQHIYKFLKELKLKYKPSYFKVCSNEDIIHRMLRNLQLSYAKLNRPLKKKEVDNLLRLFSK
jgi:regulator of sirC expression with transglutaminase-like and TPR domain